MTHPNKAMRDREQQLQQDRAELLALPSFCRVMHEWIAACGLWHTTFAGEATHTSAFNEGGRNRGLHMVADMESANPAALLLLKQHALRTPTSDTPTDE